MKEQLDHFVKKVKDQHSFCEGNEATTKASLIAPLFALLGWDMTHPKECMPEYRADFGKGEKAATPVDWAFALQSGFAFIVEAKESGKKLKPYAEQLGMYFAKAGVKLGIFTNGVQWQFYTDLTNQNIMDKEPFLTWDILKDDPIPFDFLTILQKSQFQPQLVKTFAERGRRHNLLVDELTKLLEPSSDFIKLAVRNIETRNLHPSVVEEWQPILVNAINEWAKRKMLTMVLERPAKDNLTKAADAAKSAKKFGKTCPDCNQVVGPRTKVCKCGHVFTTAIHSDESDVESDAHGDDVPPPPSPLATNEKTSPFTPKDTM